MFCCYCCCFSVYYLLIEENSTSLQTGMRNSLVTQRWQCAGQRGNNPVNNEILSNIYFFPPQEKTLLLFSLTGMGSLCSALSTARWLFFHHYSYSFLCYKLNHSHTTHHSSVLHSSRYSGYLITFLMKLQFFFQKVYIM